MQTGPVRSGGGSGLRSASRSTNRRAGILYSSTTTTPSSASTPDSSSRGDLRQPVLSPDAARSEGGAFDTVHFQIPSPGGVRWPARKAVTPTRTCRSRERARTRAPPRARDGFVTRFAAVGEKFAAGSSQTHEARSPTRPFARKAVSEPVDQEGAVSAVAGERITDRIPGSARRHVPRLRARARLGAQMISERNPTAREYLDGGARGTLEPC